MARFCDFLNCCVCRYIFYYNLLVSDWIIIYIIFIDSYIEFIYRIFFQNESTFPLSAFLLWLLKRILFYRKVVLKVIPPLSVAYTENSIMCWQ